MADSRRNNNGSPTLIFLLNTQVVVASLVLYVLNKYVFIGLSDSMFLRSYLDDILAPLILLAVTNLLLSIYKDIIMNNLLIMLSFMCLVGLFWEYVTPLYNHNSVSDPNDLMAYLLGTIIYYVIFNSGYKLLHDVLEESNAYHNRPR